MIGGIWSGLPTRLGILAISPHLAHVQNVPLAATFCSRSRPLRRLHPELQRRPLLRARNGLDASQAQSFHCHPLAAQHFGA